MTKEEQLGRLASLAGSGANLAHCDLWPRGLDVHFIIHAGNEAGPQCHGEFLKDKPKAIGKQ